MNLSQTFILRPVATTLFMVAIMLTGIVGYWQLPISALPEVDYPTIQVATFYPGASPEVMASSVTAPLERQLGQVPGLQQMTSTSSDGSSIITLQFNLSLNIDVAAQQVQQSISAAQTYLPTDLPNPPVYSKTNPADAPILTLALTSKTLPLSKIEDLADTRLAQKISQLSGVGLVSINGGQKPAVRIQANPLALASYGLSLEDIRTAVTNANLNQAKGSFDGPSQSVQIGANDQLLSSEEYSSLIIAYRNGAPVRISDVGKAVDDTENNTQAAWMAISPAQESSPSIIMNIQRQPGANIISVVDNIKKLLPKLRDSIPSSVELNILSDRTTTIRASVKDVQFELMLTVALVVGVIFVFLRSFTATIIPSVAVPLSLVGTFGAMYLLGFSLNNLTLMALTISTGFVVDDAIVMIENIMRYVEEGETPLQAALKGAGQIGFTILSLTISLIAVLIPLLFMGDIVGRLFREFAITLSITILISAVVSLTLTPMMCAWLLRAKVDQKPGWFFQVSETAFDAIIRGYGWLLRGVLEVRGLTLLIALGTLVLTFYLYVNVPKGLFPVQDTGVIQGISEADQSISFPAMAEKQQALAKVILQDPAVASISSFIGVDGTNVTMNSGRIQINLKPLEVRKGNASEIIRRLQPALAQVQGITLYMQPVQDLTIDAQISRTQYQYTLQDANADELSLWAPKLLQKFQALPELQDVATDQQNNGLRVSVHLNRDSASRFGLNMLSVDNILYDAYGQRQVSTLFTDVNQYHVILEVDPTYQAKTLDLDHIYLTPGTGTGTGTSPSSSSTSSTSNSSSTNSSTLTTSSLGSTSKNAGAVPLNTMATWTTGSGPLSINHQGQFPLVTISFNLAPGVSLSHAVAAIDAAKAELDPPVSLQTQYQGATQAFQASLTSEPLLILAALITVYIVLGVLYESFIHPITILSTLPSAGLGALLALNLFHHDLNVISLIGIILLIGIVQKNAIMMVDFALAAERHEGMEPLDAIYQACLLRFRPIIMTTLAAMLGGVPLAMGGGVGSELREPLGIAIVGGLIVSQVLTLFTTPVIYLAFSAIGRWLFPPKPVEQAKGDDLGLKHHEPETYPGEVQTT